MAIANLKVPTHDGTESGVKVRTDLKSDMQALETSNNDLEARQLIVDAAAASITTFPLDVAQVAADRIFSDASANAADAGRISAEVAAAAADADRLAAQAAWTAALAANPDLNPPVRMNPQQVVADLAIPDNYNAYASGPLEVARGVTITVGTNANLNII